MMNYSELEQIVSSERLGRYLAACKGNRDYAVALYHANIRTSLEAFAVVGAFEVALRNSINRIMSTQYGDDWLRDAVRPGGIFDVPKCREHASIIRNAYSRLNAARQYSHGRLLSKLEFGVWKYMFSNPQFGASKNILLKAFPNKPTSTRQIQYNNTYVFNELDKVNSLRNRIAHHEPICFLTGQPTITTDYILKSYTRILELFNWLGIDGADFLRDIDKFVAAVDEIRTIRDKVDNL